MFPSVVPSHKRQCAQQEFLTGVAFKTSKFLQKYCLSGKFRSTDPFKYSYSQNNLSAKPKNGPPARIRRKKCPCKILFTEAQALQKYPAVRIRTKRRTDYSKRPNGEVPSCGSVWNAVHCIIYGIISPTENCRRADPLKTSVHDSVYGYGKIRLCGHFP